MSKGDVLSMVNDLMLEMPKEDITFEILDKRKKTIITISELCKRDPLYAKTEKQRFDFYRPIGKVTPEKALVMCWVHFLDRMANARPSQLRPVIILCFPILGDILRHKGRAK